MENFSNVLPLLIPVFLLQFGMQAYAIINLTKRKKVRFDNKFLWGAVIVAGGILGTIVYLVFKGDEE